MVSLHQLTISALLTFATVAKAATSFQDIQPIGGFSSACSGAYIVPPISPCSKNDFVGFGGSGPCSESCEQRIIFIQGFVQSSCKDDRTPPDSIIGQLKAGNGVKFLCRTSDASSTAKTSSKTETQTTTTDASSTASTSSASVSTTSTAGTTSSASTSATSIATTAASSIIASDTSTFSRPTTSTRAPAPALSTVNPGGGGSPFDASANHATSIGLDLSIQSLMAATLLTTYILLLG